VTEDVTKKNSEIKLFSLPDKTVPTITTAEFNPKNIEILEKRRISSSHKVTTETVPGRTTKG
jgi:hypothetical protein